MANVSALAVALGIGAWAVAVPVIASADTVDPTVASASAESAESAGRGGPAQRAPRAASAAKPRVSSSSAPSARRGSRVGPGVAGPAAARSAVSRGGGGIAASGGALRPRVGVALKPRAAAVEAPADAEGPADGASGGAELTTLAAPAASSVSAECRTCASLRAPLASTLYPVERAIDVVGSVLSGLPANAVTDFLTGSLWLVRRSLFPVGADVGLWGSAACVATKDCSGQNLTGADFSRKDLTGVKFDDAVLNRAYFFAADLTDASLKGATWDYIKFDDANFTRADLTGADLRYQNLVGATLTGVNLTDADLREARLYGRVATELASATLVGANFTGQKFSSADGKTTLNWAGKDLTGIRLAQANLTGADLSKAILTDAELEGVNLTRANLTDAKLPQPSPLGTATLVGANLTNIDLSGADMSNMNLTGTNFTGATLLRTKFKLSDLTGANFTDAKLNDADLSGANLTRADLTRADLFKAVLTGANLTGVVWKDTTCPSGASTSTGCSAGLGDQPPADWLAAASQRRPAWNQWWPWQWYQYGGPGVEPTLGQKPPPILRATPGAPLVNWQYRGSNGYSKFPNDGVMGTIYNQSGQRVVVNVPFLYQPEGQGPQYYWSTAVMEPGDSVSYLLASKKRRYITDKAYSLWRGGDLLFSPYSGPQTDATSAKLYLGDGDSWNRNDPVTEFTPPGATKPANIRSWQPQNQSSEIWGDIDIQIKRENDGGWAPEGSEEYLKYYKYTSAWESSDWPIFTITIKKL